MHRLLALIAVLVSCSPTPLPAKERAPKARMMRAESAVGKFTVPSATRTVRWTKVELRPTGEMVISANVLDGNGAAVDFYRVTYPSDGSAPHDIRGSVMSEPSKDMAASISAILDNINGWVVTAANAGKFVR